MPSDFRSAVAFALGAALLCFAVDSEPSASANVTKPRIGGSVKPAPSRARMPSEGVAPPAPLSSLARLDALTKIVDADQIAKMKATPATLEMRLSPMRPRLDNGARIDFINGVDLTGPTPVWPDGAYWLSGKATDWIEFTSSLPSMLELLVPTQSGKHYVIDCRALEYQGGLSETYTDAVVTLKVDGVATPVQAKDGHLLAVAKASAANTRFSFEYRDNPPRPFHALVWWGCDIGKAG